MNNLFNSIIKKFEDVVTKYNNLNFDISENTKDLIIRDAETVLRKKLNDDEKENLLANPNEVIQTQMKSRLLDNAHTSLKNAVSDIEERYNDLVNLEKVKQNKI